MHTLDPLAPESPDGEGHSAEAIYEIDQFCLENRLDEEARKVLMDLEPCLLQEVLQQGAVMGARNPNAVLLSRIRRVRAGETKGKSIVPRGFDADKVDALITSFVQEHDLDDRAERTLRESDDDIVREICGTRLTDCRNASAVVVSRARQLKDDRLAGIWRGKGGILPVSSVTIGAHHHHHHPRDEAHARPPHATKRIMPVSSVSVPPPPPPHAWDPYGLYAAAAAITSGAYKPVHPAAAGSTFPSATEQAMTKPPSIGASNYHQPTDATAAAYHDAFNGLPPPSQAAAAAAAAVATTGVDPAVAAAAYGASPSSAYVPPPHAPSPPHYGAVPSPYAYSLGKGYAPY